TLASDCRSAGSDPPSDATKAAPAARAGRHRPPGDTRIWLAPTARLVIAALPGVDEIQFHCARIARRRGRSVSSPAAQTLERTSRGYCPIPESRVRKVRSAPAALAWSLVPIPASLAP